MHSHDQSIYLCGNSLGIQPRRVPERIGQYLATWASQGVTGHFKALEDNPNPAWIDMDKKAADMMAPIVGAKPEEVVLMQTLTANLHLLMCSFYKPNKEERHKIILESKAFPSDHVCKFRCPLSKPVVTNKHNSTQSSLKSSCMASTHKNP